MAYRGGIVLAALWLLLAVQTSAFTLPDQVNKLLAFKRVMETRGGHWKGNLANWTCPTPAATSNGSCDPCGAEQWWGNWEYVGCRGFTVKGYDQLGGNGYVTNLHFTNLDVEGPTLPIAEICNAGLNTLKELDIDGNLNSTPAMGGSIPQLFGECFPYLESSKLSFNELTGSIPAIITNNTNQQSFKVRGNKMTGVIPEEIGSMPFLYYLDLAENSFIGGLPYSMRNSKTLSEITLANNNFTGNLYNAPKHLQLIETANNKGLCGMVPAAVRWATGYNPSGTGLGQPCPGETYPLNFPPGF